MKRVSLFAIALIAVVATAFTISGNSQITGAAPGKWKMGVALYSFNKFPLQVAVEKAKASGASYVEGFDFHDLGPQFGNKSYKKLSPAELKEVKSILDKSGVQMKSMYVGTAKTVDEWKFYFEIGKELGVTFLVCEPQRSEWDMLDSLASIYKMKIAIHQHSRKHSYYWHPDSVVTAMKGHPNFGACADLGHWVRSGLDPVECLAKLKGNIISIHLKDLDRAGSDDAKDVVVGKGVIDFKKVVSELKRQKFSGLVYVESENEGDNQADATEAYRYFTSLEKTIK
jgi:L-ribulose-5-phosphate 3-epimerase